MFISKTYAKAHPVRQCSFTSPRVRGEGRPAFAEAAGTNSGKFGCQSKPFI
jgi:hypothetical protein